MTTLPEDYVTRHFLEAVSSHIVDQRGQSHSQEPCEQAKAPFAHHAYKTEKARQEAASTSRGGRNNLQEESIDAPGHDAASLAPTNWQANDSQQHDTAASQAADVDGYVREVPQASPPAPPDLPAAFGADYAAHASHLRSSNGLSSHQQSQPLKGRQGAQSAGAQEMGADVDRMFSESQQQAGAQGVPAAAASEGAKAKAAELGQEGLSELLMAWYYAGYCTGRHEAMQTKITS